MAAIMPAHILIIEDNPDNLELMQYLLETSGYQVMTAADGEAGIRMAESELPDLILCDVQMPNGDGYQVVRHLRKDARFLNVPVVAVTALAMVGDRERTLAAGFDGYLSKPIEPEIFVGQVEAFLPAELRGDSTA